MSSLRSRLIRLAHQQPSLRPHLLPLISRTAGAFSEKMNPYELSYNGLDYPETEEDERGIEMVTQDLDEKIEAAAAKALTGLEDAARDAMREHARHFNTEARREFIRVLLEQTTDEIRSLKRMAG